MSTTIRVSDETHDRLAELARITGKPMTQLLDDATESLERKVFFDRLDARFAELRADTAAWSAVETERQAESSTLGDESRRP